MLLAKFKSRRDDLMVESRREVNSCRLVVIDEKQIQIRHVVFTRSAGDNPDPVDGETWTKMLLIFTFSPDNTKFQILQFPFTFPFNLAVSYPMKLIKRSLDSSAFTLKVPSKPDTVPVVVPATTMLAPGSPCPSSS